MSYVLSHFLNAQEEIHMRKIITVVSALAFFGTVSTADAGGSGGCCDTPVVVVPVDPAGSPSCAAFGLITNERGRHEYFNEALVNIDAMRSIACTAPNLDEAARNSCEREFCFYAIQLNFARTTAVTMHLDPSSGIDVDTFISTELLRIYELAKASLARYYAGCDVDTDLCRVLTMGD